jgi:hypothetical protein
MPLEQVAELQIFAQHIEAFVTAESPELGGVGAALHAGGQRAGLEAVAAEVARHRPSCRGAGLNDAADRPSGERFTPKRRQGRGVSGLTWGDSQIRRNIGPSVIAATCSQRERARTGQSSVRP